MASVVLAARASASLARARNSSRRRSSGSLLFMMLMLMLLPLDGRQSPGLRASCLLTLLPLIRVISWFQRGRPPGTSDSGWDPSSGLWPNCGCGPQPLFPVSPTPPPGGAPISFRTAPPALPIRRFAMVAARFSLIRPLASLPCRRASGLWIVAPLALRQPSANQRPGNLHHEGTVTRRRAYTAMQGGIVH